MSAPRDTLSCGTARGDLHRWFDGELLDEELARHVRDCAHCTAELGTIENQHDALASLSGRSRGTEVAMDSSRRAAESALADLLAELAEACLPSSDSRAHDARPARSWAAVRAEVTLMATRLAQLGVRIDTSELPDRAPAPAEGPAFAQRCVAVLAVLEGPSARTRALSGRCAAQGAGD